MKTLLIDQPAGIGDILFVQKISKHYSENGFKVWHPVNDSIDWLPQYLDTVCKKEDCKNINFDNYLKLDGCSNGTNYKIMEAKYKTANLDYSNYIDYIDIKRNREKEDKLFDLLVGSNIPYRLVNSMYATPTTKTGGTLYMNVEKSTSIRNIEVSIISGYTLFDWIKIIENASEIYTTDTAIMYLIEKYPCVAKTLVCYSRRSSANEIDYLFKKPWKYII